MHQARETVACTATNAWALARVLLVKHHTKRSVKRMQSRGGEIVREVLEPRLMTYRWPRIGLACRRFRRVLPSVAVHLVKVLGVRVVRFQLVVTDRPGRRDAAMMANLSKIPLAQAAERCSVEFRISADVIVRGWMQLLVVRVSTEFMCVILGVHIDWFRTTVGFFAIN